MPIQNRNYYGAIQTGREDALNQQAMQQRNALGRMEVGRQQQFNALAQNPAATPDQYTRIGRSDVGNALLNQQQFASKQKQVDSERLFMAAQYGINSQSPKQFIAQNFPEIAEMNPNFATETDEQVRAGLQELLGKFGPQAGIAPTPQKPKLEQRQGPRGSILTYDPATGELKQVVGPDNTQPRVGGATWRPATPQDISAYGMPPGTTGQVNESTGEFRPFPSQAQPPKLAASERKAMTEAKVKLPQVDAAMRRVERLGQAVEAISKNWMFDGGPADAKALAITKDGREVIAASAQLMPVLTALTRVPGVGSQSDLEQRLASMALPSNEFDPETNAKSMDELRLFVQDLKTALQSIASGEQFDVPATDSPPQQPSTQGPVRVSSPQEAMALPSGTQFVTPDGRIKVRP
jgi:hypothetical protein